MENPLEKEFGCYSVDYYGETSYVAILPSLVVVYGNVPSQNFMKSKLKDDFCIRALMDAAQHYKEGIVDKVMLDASLDAMFENFAIDLKKYEKIKAIAKSCDCFADAFGKKLITHGIPKMDVDLLTYRRERQELLDSCEFFHEFLNNYTKAVKLF